MEGALGLRCRITIRLYFALSSETYLPMLTGEVEKLAAIVVRTVSGRSENGTVPAGDLAPPQMHSSAGQPLSR